MFIPVHPTNEPAPDLVRHMMVIRSHFAGLPTMIDQRHSHPTFALDPLRGVGTMRAKGLGFKED
ncbi:hypothetical protein K3179_04075 [Qipengyuania sp. GH38]|uniref:hypothetical protein n=1 Tax=Qipengyuania intermedia TaxID=2867244 RepID=UPI001C875819|nr:hypothetical protein [Qipengyuania intermedia]MBX7513721.1 hypothetical protein [Qipengyuania intermedia]